MMRARTRCLRLDRPSDRVALDLGLAACVLHASRNPLVLVAVTWQASLVAGDVVWWPAGPQASHDGVTVLVVSYNTRELTAFLLWSLRTVLGWPELEIVVVDNGSRDGSAQLLAEAERAGLCTLLANQANLQHGPGLNQGISYLASRPGPRPAWIWILDSDVVVARPDALWAAVTVAREQFAALVGEPQDDQWHSDGRFGQYSLLLDPAVAWQPRTGPFTGGGDPSSGLLTAAAQLGLPMASFPFTAAGHIIHRGRGSLAAVHAAGDRSHPLYEWAAGHHEPHFAGVPGAAERYHALLQEFRDQTGPLTGQTLAAACRREPVHE
jgi:Glycosyl transferase family 2